MNISDIECEMWSFEENGMAQCRTSPFDLWFLDLVSTDTGFDTKEYH